MSQVAHSNSTAAAGLDGGTLRRPWGGEASPPGALFSGKRVLHLIGDSGFGGDTIYLFALADRVREYGAEVFVGTTAPETIAMARKKGYPVIEVPSLKRPIN